MSAGVEGCGGALGAEMAQLCPLSRQLETLFHFLQLVAGVEHYQLKFRSQAAVIDEIVDTTFEVNQAGPGRSQVERAGHWKARLRVLVPGSGPSESSVGFQRASTRVKAADGHPCVPHKSDKTPATHKKRTNNNNNFPTAVLQVN